MIKKYLAFALLVLVTNLACGATAFAQTQNNIEAESLKKVKIRVAKIGTGRNAQTFVRLKDGTKLKGYLVDIKDDSFVVVDKKTGASTPIQYTQVSKVKGTKLSRAAAIAIGAGAAAGGVLLTLFILLSVSLD